MEHLKLSDFDTRNVDIDVKDGQTIRAIHVGCSTHQNGAITRKGRAWLMYCHKCARSGVYYEQVENLYKDVICATTGGKGTRGMTTYRPPTLGGTNYLSRYGIDVGKVDYGCVDPSVHGDNVALPIHDSEGRWDGESKAIRCLEPGAVLKWRIDLRPGTMRLYTCQDYRTEIKGLCVITEDILSAIKVHQATGHTTHALMGLNLSTEVLVHLATYWDEFIVWADNDEAGQVRGAQICDRLDALGKSVLCGWMPGKKDPKDHMMAEIRKLTYDAIGRLRGRK